MAKVWIFLAGLALCAVLGYAVWQLERNIHYRLSYEDKVEQTVREMVKPEALK